jgi:Flp pilus assembly protein TadD
MEATYADLRGQAVLEGRDDPFGMSNKSRNPTDIVRSARPIVFPVRPATPTRPEATSVTALQHKVPKEAAKANDRGLKLAKKSEHTQATTEFQKAVALDPEFADAHSNLGTEYFMAGRVAESRIEFLRAVELNPGLAIAYTNLATAELALGEMTDASAHVRRGIALGDISNEAQALLKALPY